MATEQAIIVNPDLYLASLGEPRPRNSGQRWHRRSMWLRRSVWVPHHIAHHAQPERNQAIWEGYLAGETQVSLARRFKISRQRVNGLIAIRRRKNEA